MAFAAAMELLQAGRWEEGARELRAALAREPGHAAAWSNLGFALRELDRLPEAREALERATALDPRLADAWNLLGLVEQDEARHDAARAAFERAIALRPAFAYAHMNLGNTEQALGREAAALARYAEALRLGPALAEVHYNAGRLHDRAGRLGEGERHYREALRANPRYSIARANLAHLLIRAERLDDAIAELGEATRLDPRFATAQIQLAHALFLAGRFSEAWRQNRWRESRTAAMAREGRDYALPALDQLAGARVNIVAEQGLGDMLFFLRFAPALRARGAVLGIAADARLHPMLARTGLFEEIAATAAELRRPGALEVLAGDLALLATDAVAPALPLAPDPVRTESIARALAHAGPAPHVAIAWRAGTPHGGTFLTLHKEVPPAALGEALRGIDATWISVQRNPGEGELAALQSALGAPVHDFGGVNTDLDDALAAMALTDEYAGVSSTNVHLRAGAGRTSRVLVPFPPEWRWSMRGDSAWFPGSAIYRQEARGGWGPALERMARELSLALAR
jgi:tetratricopeptide (TPR) repeat protein